ncbi:MAG: 16S rRNA (guanine(966)-N(2))-methyltransferase RsmD [Pseudohongiellaceae bacterium]
MSSTPSGNTLRVIGGKWRSRKISFPVVDNLRPTGDRIRETLFNWLQSTVPGSNCLDLFAGSGACGIEALSREASHVFFIEQDVAASNSIAANLRTLGSSQGEVLCSDAFAWLASYDESNARKFDIVFVDPPYKKDLTTLSAQKLESSGCLKPDALIYIESDKPLALEGFPQNWMELKHKKAGKVNYYLFGRQPVAAKSNP